MKKIYACLLGDWVCLNDDPDSIIDRNGQSPFTWWEEGAPIYAPFSRSRENSLYELDYVDIHYKGKDYRINPIFIQIVTE